MYKCLDLDQYSLYTPIGSIKKGFYSSTWFTLVGQEPLRLTRNTAYHGNLVAARSKTDIRSNFFTNRVIAKWNELPSEVKDSRNFSIFKSKLDELLN